MPASAADRETVCNVDNAVVLQLPAVGSILKALHHRPFGMVATAECCMAMAVVFTKTVSQEHYLS